MANEAAIQAEVGGTSAGPTTKYGDYSDDYRPPGPDDWRMFMSDFVELHGGIGDGGKAITKVSPDFENDPSVPGGMVKRPVLNPRYMVRFNDNTTVEYRWNGTSYELIGGGYKPSPRAQKKINDEVNNRPITAAPGSSIVDPKTGEVITTIPDRPPAPPSATEQGNLAVSQGNLAISQAREIREAQHQKRQEELDRKRAESEAERDRINLLVQQGKLDADTAVQRYKEWFDKNVTIPMKIAEERRARTQEARLAAEFKFNQQKAGADYEKDRSKVGLDLGMNMMTLAQNQQKYSFGPTFPEEWAAGVNNLANRSSEPINFTADAFRMQAPDYESIAQRAMASALSAISPWAQQMQQQPATELPVTQYPEDPGVDMTQAPTVPEPPKLW